MVADPGVDDDVGSDPVVDVSDDAREDRVRPDQADRDAGDGVWYRALLDTISDVVLVLDERGVIEYANETTRHVFGHEPSDLVGESAFEYIHEADRRRIADQYTDYTNGESDEFPDSEFRVERPDGCECWVEATGRDRIGVEPLDGFVVCLREVTDRRSRREELARYEMLVETAPMGIFTLDENAFITWANDVYAENLGTPREELIGTHFLELVDQGRYRDDVPEEYLDHVRTLLSSKNDVEKVTYRVETFRPDGERLVHDANLALLPLDDGEFQGTVIAFRDVTKQHRYERELERQNERLDTFASMVSHDLRNPLSVAKGRLQLAHETGEREHFEEVEAAHEHMESLIADLLSLARDGRTVEEPTRGELEAVASGAWESVETGDATLQVLDGGWAFDADHDRVQQLLENLFGNALEHGSTDHVARSDDVDHDHTDRPAGSITVTVGVLDGGDGFYVSDDGRGIPESERDLVFEHGYSTNESGTGIGLEIVESIADAHGWSVEVTDGDAGGARFEFRTGKPEE